MNKKLLIGAAIAMTLLISACVKKEAPKEEAETKGQEVSQPAQFQNLSSVDHASASSTEIPTQVTNETLQQNNQNTHATHPQQTETHSTPAPAAHVDRAEPPVPAAKPAAATERSVPVEKPAAPVAKITEATKPVVQANTTAKAQSEDDAVAAAIAAAAPALKN